MTRTFPELDQTVIVCNEKLSKFFGNDSQVYLREVDRRVEDKSCCINRVSDDNDFQYSQKIGSLIDTTSDGEELSFSRCDVNYMMNYLDNGFVTDINISDGSNNIILDACIQDDKNMRVVHQCRDSDIIELVSVIFEIVVFIFYLYKGKTKK